MNYPYPEAWPAVKTLCRDWRHGFNFQAYMPRKNLASISHVYNC